MKKQKAFTLIELLAVIVILAVIALIASPIIMGVIGKTKRQAFERSIDGILDAVRIDYSSDGFVSPREYFYEGNNLILLTVNEETLDENVGIKGKINGKGFIYIDGKGTIHVENVCSKDYCANGTEPNVVITENVTGEIPELSKNDPMIKIKGDKTVYVNIGDTYTELGATAKTMSGQVLEYTTEITLNGEVVTSIDTTNENTYVITYKTEHDGKTVTDTRNVIVLDMKPVVSITEGKDSFVKEQEILMTTSAVRPNTITSFTVEIKKDGESIKTETVTGISKTITLNETGNYEVIVTVTDNHEHRNTITKTYKIDSEPPVIEFTSEITLKANEVSGFVFSEDDTVVVSDNTNLVTWETEGNLNSIIGEQEITYIATDEAGNETRKTRVFHIETADGPVLNYSSASSDNIWIKATTITLYAEIRVENDELTAFTYQVDDGEIVNVPITNNKQMEVSVDLNTTGRHSIKVTATGKHGNKREETIGEFLIDVVTPTLTINSDYNGKVGDNKALSTLYTTIFGGMGGTVTCKNGSTSITNVSDLKLAGEYTIKCKAIGNNEKSSEEKIVSLILKPKEFTDVMVGSSVKAEDSGNNPRYVGSNPSNYVRFNNELWRIIGVFDGRVKIVRATNLGGRPKDSTNTTADWPKTELATYLNDTYWNEQVDATSRSYVETHTWSLGGHDSWSGTRSEFYNDERGTTVPTDYSTTWNGKVGLIYPSDYGYSSNGGSNCDNISLSIWNSSTTSEGNICYTNSWMKSIGGWTMTPIMQVPHSFILYNNSTHGIGGDTPNWNLGVFPVVYLKTSVKIHGGTGTSDDPYILGTDLNDQDCTRKTETIMGKQVTGCMLNNDPGNNLRYVGSNPSNYVKFNNELWRIIGVFGDYTKIIRDDFYGDPTVWHGNYVNDWSVSPINTAFNDTYYKTIDNTSKSYIQEYNWNLGGLTANEVTRGQLYSGERGTAVYEGRPTSWPGNLALMYASDFAYATSSTNSICDTEDVVSTTWAQNCGNNNWLLNSHNNQWTITPRSNSVSYLYVVLYYGPITSVTTHNKNMVRPSLYLKKTVKIKSGTGTSNDPYILGT